MSFYIQVLGESILSCFPEHPLMRPPGTLGIDAFVVGEEPPQGSRWVDGQVVPPPPPTDDELVAEARSAAWSRIKNERQARLAAPITVGTLTFDADDVSQAKILAAIQVADIVGSTWSATWTLADNTSAMVTRTVLADVVMLVGARTNQIYAQARALREQLDAAQTLEQVAAVTWPAQP